MPSTTCTPLFQVTTTTETTVSDFRPSHRRGRNINALQLGLPAAKRSDSIDSELETPKTPREMIREMSHPNIVFGSSIHVCVTPTIFLSFADDNKNSGITARPSDTFRESGLEKSKTTDGYESDDFSWDFKCRGSEEPDSDNASVLNLLSDLQNTNPSHETTTPTTTRMSPTNVPTRPSIFEEFERNLSSRHTHQVQITVHRSPLKSADIMPIFCVDDTDVLPPTEPQRRPLVAFPANAQSSADSTSQRRLRGHIRTSSRNHDENVPTRVKNGTKAKAQAVGGRGTPRLCIQGLSKKPIGLGLKPSPGSRPPWI